MTITGVARAQFTKSGMFFMALYSQDIRQIINLVCSMNERDLFESFEVVVNEREANALAFLLEHPRLSNCHALNGIYEKALLKDEINEKWFYRHVNANEIFEISQ